MTPFEFRTVPRIVFGPGASARLAETLAPLGAPKRVFVVTDKGVRGAKLLDGPLAALEAAGVATQVFDDVVADPPEDIVVRAGDAAKAFRADAVVGFGGGSPMDTAKVVALLLRSPQPLADMYGVGAAVGPRAPLVLVPTTAGTGSEVTPIAVITVGETTKLAVNAPAAYADAAVLDPDLTLGLPRHVTAATGIDAMVHATEAYTSKRLKNPVSDALAREALRLLHRAIERACADGADKDARADMLLGAMLAGQAFANAPVAAVHALAYPIGGVFHVAHGLSNALVLPHVLRFNAPAAETLYAELADVVAPGKGATIAGKTAAFVDELERICDATGVERRLTQVGINHNDLPRLAEDAMKQTRLLVNNPREVTQADAQAIYEAAL